MVVLATVGQWASVRKRRMQNAWRVLPRDVIQGRRWWRAVGKTSSGDANSITDDEEE